MGASNKRALARRSRRRFLISGALLTGGLIVGIDIGTRRDRIGDEDSLKAADDNEFVFNAWIKIDSDGWVTVAVPRTEMGQGIYTALAQLVAEELDADWSKVRAQQAPVDRVYANIALATEWVSGGEEKSSYLSRRLSGLFAMQITGGSTSVRDAWQPMRQAGALVRNMLLQAAAHYWDVGQEECEARNGQIIHLNSGRRLSFGKIAPFAAHFSAEDGVNPKDPSGFRIIGRSLARLDIPEKLVGSATFGIDTRLPNMLYAASRPTRPFGAKLQSYDAGAVIGIPGIRHIVELDDAIAVVADNYWKAKTAIEALPVRYTADESSLIDSEQIQARLEKALEEFGSEPDAALSSAGGTGSTLSADYYLPFLAHACMEPMNATARVDDNSCEVWSATQAPDLARKVAASITGLAEDDITIHTPYAGGGFGRRVEMDAVAQAVSVARHTNGLPVKLVFSREQDMQAGVYRPATVCRQVANVKADGEIISWRQKIAAPSAVRGFGKRWLGPSARFAPDSSITEGARDMPYRGSAHQVEAEEIETPVPVGFWRSVAHSCNAFFKECFVDEMAHKAGIDPLEFRLNKLQKDSRHYRTLQYVAGQIDWQTPRQDGTGVGLAVHESFGSVVAQAIEVEAAVDGSLRLHRMVCAVDCGLAIHPDGVRAQVEGGAIFGLTAALFGEIHIDRGQVRESNFHDYPLLTLAQTPTIEVFIADSAEPPAGVGEIAVPPAAPALVNAIFAATGRRIRRLPLVSQGFSLA